MKKHKIKKTYQEICCEQAEIPYTLDEYLFFITAEDQKIGDKFLKNIG